MNAAIAREHGGLWTSGTAINRGGDNGSSSINPVKRSSSTSYSGASEQLEMDAYAQRLLNEISGDLAVDDSLGAYVTSCLRNSPAVAKVADLPDYEAVLELLQEHCQVENAKLAEETLQKIATAIYSGIIPPVNASLEFTSSPAPSRLSASESEHQSVVVSPLAADNLLPLDLLYEEEETVKDANVSSEDAVDGTASFPPLGSAGETSTTSGARPPKAPPHLQPPTLGKHSKSHSFSSTTSSNKDKSVVADELATSLFRQSRSRQSSIDETSPSLHPAVPTMQPPATFHREPSMVSPADVTYCAELLIYQNTDVSPDAALAASTMANAHLRMAQGILDAASTQTPICRHLLTDGCYRADCAFSHEVDNHTCIFWLRRTCGKGAANCKFRHGFSESLLEHLPEYDQEEEDQQYGEHQQYAQYEQYEQYDQQYVTNTSNSYGEYSVPSHSSWIPSPPPSANSFANIASSGYNSHQSFVVNPSSASSETPNAVVGTTKIPQNLWIPHRDSSAFHISDPMERYYTVQQQSAAKPRQDVIDLHFQSLSTFSTVLDNVMDTALRSSVARSNGGVWIVTGTGHSVGSQTHQKGGGALEQAVLDYLSSYSDYYRISQGRDRNGQGGAIFVQQK